MQLSIVSIITAFMATTVLATHQLGSSCATASAGNFGCSNDECTVLQCVTAGNGNYYWALSQSCIGIKCENGACDSNFAKSSCTA